MHFCRPRTAGPNRLPDTLGPGARRLHGMKW